MTGLLKVVLRSRQSRSIVFQLAGALHYADATPTADFNRGGAVGWMAGGVYILRVRSRSLSCNTQGHTAGRLSQDSAAFI